MEIKVNNYPGQILNWLIPARCIRCEDVLDDPLYPCCPDCYAKLPFEDSACIRCGQILNSMQEYCGRCIARPPSFDVCFCPFRYQGAIAEQIKTFKYGDRPELAKGLARLLATEFEASGLEKPELLIPVPLHINKLRQRGFNQSALLAGHLGKLLGVPYSSKYVHKTRATPPQVEQSMKQRRSNVRGSFQVKRLIPAKKLAIVDDVITTGATAEEITKILKRNGVDYVQVLGLAHTM